MSESYNPEDCYISIGGTKLPLIDKKTCLSYKERNISISDLEILGICDVATLVKLLKEKGCKLKDLAPIVDVYDTNQYDFWTCGGRINRIEVNVVWDDALDKAGGNIIKMLLASDFDTESHFYYSTKDQALKITQRVMIDD